MNYYRITVKNFSVVAAHIKRQIVANTTVNFSLEHMRLH